MNLFGGMDELARQAYQEYLEGRGLWKKPEEKREPGERTLRNLIGDPDELARQEYVKYLEAKRAGIKAAPEESERAPGPNYIDKYGNPLKRIDPAELDAEEARLKAERDAPGPVYLDSFGNRLTYTDPSELDAEEARLKAERDAPGPVYLDSSGNRFAAYADTDGPSLADRTRAYNKEREAEKARGQTPAENGPQKAESKPAPEAPSVLNRTRTEDGVKKTYVNGRGWLSEAALAEFVRKGSVARQDLAEGGSYYYLPSKAGGAGMGALNDIRNEPGEGTYYKVDGLGWISSEGIESDPRVMKRTLADGSFRYVKTPEGAELSNLKKQDREQVQAQKEKEEQKAAQGIVNMRRQDREQLQAEGGGVDSARGAGYNQDGEDSQRVAGQTYLGAVTPEEAEQWQAARELWLNFTTQFKNDREMLGYLTSLSPEKMQGLPDAVRFQAQLYVDEAKRNAEDYLKYLGYGDIPWLAALSSGLLDGMTLGTSGAFRNIADPNAAQQLELAEKKYPWATRAGNMAGWMLPGSAGRAVAEVAGKAISPLTKPIGGFIAKGAEKVLGTMAPKAARIAGRGAAGAVEGGAAGYGAGFIEGGVRSVVEGNDPLGVIRDANEEGVRFVGPSAVAGGLLGAFGVSAHEGAGNAINKLPKTTAESVSTKLDTYLLEPTHPVGGSKAKWFKEALGFTKDNSADLAKQIVFDPKKAVQTAANAHGTKFSQIISVQGANGKIIDVEFIFIKNNDGVIRLVTSIPTKR